MSDTQTIQIYGYTITLSYLATLNTQQKINFFQHLLWMRTKEKARKPLFNE